MNTTTENPILKVIDEKSARKTVLLLGGKQSKVTPTVQETINKFDDFGINNKSVAYLKDKAREDAKEQQHIKEHNAKSSVVKKLAEMFFPFNIIEYKVMHELAVDHKLVICPLSWYDEAIPEENLEELQLFKEKFTEVAEEFANLKEPFEFMRSHMFQFMKYSSQENSTCFGRMYNCNFADLFNVMAPVSHFKKEKMEDERTIRVGNEFKESERKKPKVKLSKLMINKPVFPVPDMTDPVVFSTFRFGDRNYCIVATAWDKVADDERIRTLI